MNKQTKNKIEYIGQLELAIQYAKLSNKILIYEYKDFYCQDSHYSNFGFFNCAENNFDELCEIIFDYMITNKFDESQIEIESYFENDQMEFYIVKSGYFCKIINFDKNNLISFANKDEIFLTNIKNIRNNYKQQKYLANNKKSKIIKLL